MVQAASPSEPMVRMQIMVPREQKNYVEELARQEGVSAGEIVRRAVFAYKAVSDEDRAILEALADQVIESTQSACRILDRAEQAVAMLHKELEAHRYGTR